MMSEEEKQLVIEAKTCDNCLDWHKHCRSECCMMIHLNIPPAEFQRQMSLPGEYLICNKPLLPNDRWYFKLHDVVCLHGILKFKKDRCTIIEGRIIYAHKCDFLTDDLKCKGHPNNKPNICKNLTMESAKQDNKKFIVTAHCLFKYKNLEVDVNDEKISQESKNGG